MKNTALHIVILLVLWSVQSLAQTEARRELHELNKKLAKRDTAGALIKINELIEEFEDEEDRTGLSAVLVSKGSYLFTATDRKGAFEQYYKGLEIARELKNDTLIAEASFQVGQKYYFTTNYPLAMKNLGVALRIFEHKKREERVANIYRMYATIESTLGSQEKSLEYLDKAYAYYSKKGDKEQMGALLNNYGHTHMSFGDTLKAKVYLLMSLKLREELKDLVGIGQVYTNLGTLATKTNRFEEALANYKKGYELRVQGKAQERVLVESHIFIGKTLYQMGNTKDAVTELEKGLNTAEKIKSPELQRRALEVLKDVYLAMGDASKAFKAQEQYYIFKDSLFGLDKREQLLKETVGQEFEKRMYEDSLRNAEKEKHILAVQEAKNKHQSLIRNVLIGCILVAGGIVVMLFRQNKEKKRTHDIIVAQRDQLSMKQAEITDSINYAKQIQKAVLPNPAVITSAFENCFNLYLPKDVVSGDFYWFSKQNNKLLIAAADCTGHGVPGAFMSMIGIDKLNQAAIEQGLEKPSDILSHINRTIKHALKQEEAGSKSRDGMDIALCCFDLEKMKVEYAGANRNLWIVRNDQLIEHKATKASIAGWTSSQQAFDNNILELHKGDTIYLHTDGYADQFGGDKGKKMRTANFKKLLLSIQHLSMNEQEKHLHDFHKEWAGNLEQVDDILVIGIRI